MPKAFSESGAWDQPGAAAYGRGETKTPAGMQTIDQTIAGINANEGIPLEQRAFHTQALQSFQNAPPGARGPNIGDTSSSPFGGVDLGYDPNEWRRSGNGWERGTLWMEDGGAVPGPEEMGEAPANPMGDKIAKALSTVKETLGFGRKKFGITGDEGGEQQEARMSTVPGTPSNSGVPRPQPMPGPLPPTKNPFGKRADAGGQMFPYEDEA